LPCVFLEDFFLSGDLRVMETYSNDGFFTWHLYSLDLFPGAELLPDFSLLISFFFPKFDLRS